MCKRKRFNIEKINSVCLDRAPTMAGETNSFIVMPIQFLGRTLFSYCFIIHKKTLCTKHMNCYDVIDPVVQ